MPIHLPPLARRSFIKQSVLAAAGLALTPELFAAMRATAADTWALLADTHIAADPAHVERSVNMTGNFKAVARELLALPRRPAGVMVVGDCAFSKGEPGDYAAFTGLLDPLRGDDLAIHLTLGNHDHRENFRSALDVKGSPKRPVADRQVALIRSPLVNWFILDSLETTLQAPGLVGPEQLAWLATTLDANPEKPAVILVHHNPGLEGNLGLKDTLGLWNVLRPRSQVKAWVYGHTHTWKVMQDESGIHLVNLPPVAYVFRAGDPSGWVQATARTDGMKLELRCVEAAHKDHAAVVDLKWRPSSGSVK